MEPEKAEEKDGQEGKERNQIQNTKIQHMEKHGSILVVGIVIIIVLAIGAGAMVIGHEFRGNKGFESKNNMMIGRGGVGYGMGRDGMMNRGAGIRAKATNSGSIKSIDGNGLTVTINSKDVAVVIADTTSIYNSDGSIASKSDLKVNQSIAIFGRPNSSGQINANTIMIK